MSNPETTTQRKFRVGDRVTDSAGRVGIITAVSESRAAIPGEWWPYYDVIFPGHRAPGALEDDYDAYCDDELEPANVERH